MPSETTPGSPSAGDPQTEESPWDTEHFLSVTEASTAAQVSDETIRAWYDNGEITGIRDERGARHITRVSLERRLNSIGVIEAARTLNRSEYHVRRWFDAGHFDGYITVSGRRRIFRDSIDAFAKTLEEESSP